MELAQYKKYRVSILGTGGLMLKHQLVSNHCADYEPEHFQLFMS